MRYFLFLSSTALALILSSVANLPSNPSSPAWSSPSHTQLGASRRHLQHRLHEIECLRNGRRLRLFPGNGRPLASGAPERQIAESETLCEARIWRTRRSSNPATGTRGAAIRNEGTSGHSERFRCVSMGMAFDEVGVAISARLGAGLSGEMETEGEAEEEPTSAVDDGLEMVAGAVEEE